MFWIRQEDFTCWRWTGIIDKDLNFQSHTKSIIKTANQKQSVLIRVVPLMTDFNKKVFLTPIIKG